MTNVGAYADLATVMADLAAPVRNLDVSLLVSSLKVSGRIVVEFGLFIFIAANSFFFCRAGVSARWLSELVRVPICLPRRVLSIRRAYVGLSDGENVK